MTKFPRKNALLISTVSMKHDLSHDHFSREAYRLSLLHFVLAGVCLMAWARGIANDEKVAAQRCSVETAVAFLRDPRGDAGNASLFETEVYYTFLNFWSETKYKFDRTDLASWKAIINGPSESLRTRLCAAYFALEADDPDARNFVETEMRSTDLRSRENAAQIIVYHVGGNANRTWGVNLLTDALASGSLDKCITMLGTVCSTFGSMKLKSAVPVLVDTLDRTGEQQAAMALGEIGDRRAIPILLKVAAQKKRTYGQGKACWALGQLRSKEAVPTLIARLNRRPRDPDEWQWESYDAVLEALLMIGDKRAVSPIKKLLRDERTSEHLRAVGIRVLAQLDTTDPVGALLTLLAKENDPSLIADLLSDLADYSDDRGSDKLVELSNTASSELVRRRAIEGLCALSTKKSLNAVVNLLNEPFPDDLKYDFAKMPIKDFTIYFHDHIRYLLVKITGTDLGSNTAAWREWIDANRT